MSSEQTPTPRRPGATLDDLPSLAAFGDRLMAVDARRSRGIRGAVGAGALLGAIVAAVTFTGAAAVALTAATGSPIPAFARGDDTAFYPAPGSTRISDVRAADPAGGPAWSVRVGRSDDGLVCLGVGQVHGGRFGIRGLDGVFRDSSPVGNDACGPAPAPSTPVVAVRAFSGPSAVRPAGATTVVYGSGGAGVRRVEVRTGDGRSRRVPVGRSATFALAVPGWPEGVAPTVKLAWSGGRVTTVVLGRTDYVPDPGGRFGWTTAPVFSTRLPGHSRVVGCLYLEPSRSPADRAPACLADGGPVLRPLRIPSSGASRRVLLVRIARGDVVRVRVGGRTVPTVRSTTAGAPQRAMRRVVRRGGRRMLVREQNPGGGPSAAVAVLPARTRASDVRVTVVSGGHARTTAPTEGGPR